MGFWTKRKVKKAAGAKRRLRKLGEEGRLYGILERGSFVKGLIAVTGCAGAILIISMGRVQYRESIDLYVGQPAPKDIFADIGFSYENKEETEKLRKEASQKVLPHYSFSAEKIAECLRQIRDSLGIHAGEEDEVVLAAGEGAKGDSDRTALLPPHAVEPLKGVSDPAALAAWMEAFLSSLRSPDLMTEAERALVSTQEGADGERHRRALIAVAGLRAEKEAGNLFPRDRRMRDAVADLLRLCCEKSAEFDEEFTQRMKDAAANKVKPVIMRVQPGRKIVDRGYEVTAQQIDAYAAYLARREQVEPLAMKMRDQLYYALGLALLVVMFCIASRRYLMYYQGQVYRSNSSLFMLELIFLGALLVSRLIALIPFGSIKSNWNNLFFYAAAVSVPTAAILMTLLLNRTLALFFTVLVAIFVGVLKRFSLPYAMVGLVGGIVAVYSTIGVRRRSEIVKAGATIALANIITIGALDAVENINIVSATAAFRVAGGFMLGMLSAFLAASFLPLLEHAFNVVTDFRLLELSDLNHPLLKKMFIEAPGTYNHSLMVGNLAEAAAEAVGANPLQVRVCAYFHDIGKMEKPQYFTENRRCGKSKHDELNPQMSSLIIRSHVKDGLDMAIRNKLNRKIVEAIREHHGTSLVYFFYRRAEEARAEGEEVAQEDFRYSGPKPQSKETAILLLADAVEAASRSLEKPTPSRVRNLVWKIINQRIIDGQLNECDLTFDDLRLIGERFEYVLNGSFHTRVRYPERGEPEGKEKISDESVGAEQLEEPED